MLINLTPHPINLVDKDGNVLKTLPASGWELRLSSSTVPVGDVDGWPTSKTVFGAAEVVKSKNWNGQEAPEFAPLDEFGARHDKNPMHYIVSMLAKSAHPDAVNLYVPSEVVRDANGNVVGCQSLGL